MSSASTLCWSITLIQAYYIIVYVVWTSQTFFLARSNFFFQAWRPDLPTDPWSGILIPTPPWVMGPAPCAAKAVLKSRIKTRIKTLSTMSVTTTSLSDSLPSSIPKLDAECKVLQFRAHRTSKSQVYNYKCHFIWTATSWTDSSNFYRSLCISCFASSILCTSNGFWNSCQEDRA